MNLINYKTKQIKLTPFLIGMLVLVLTLIIIFHQFILTPNTYLMYDHGDDGLKNYYLFAWLAKYGNSNGLNFPFGEIVLLSDSVPFIGSIIYFLKYLGFDITNYSIAILHIILFGCYPISYLYTYKTLEFFNKNAIINSIGALVIVLGCPVNSRILIHFGLFFIILTPCLLYLIIKATQNNKQTITLSSIFFLNLIGFYLHGYTGTLWAGTTIFIFLCFSIAFKKNRYKYLSYSFLGVIPTVIYTLSISLLDNHLWRSAHTTILYDFRIFFKNIFHKLYFEDIYIHDSLQFNYYFWCIIILTFYILVKSIKRQLKVKHLFIYISFYTVGAIFLLYGLTFFIRIKTLLVLIPQLEQIRDLLRFGWVSFFLFLIPSLSLITNKVNNKILAPILIFGFFEAINYQHNIYEHSEKNINIFQTSEKNLHINSNEHYATIYGFNDRSSYHEIIKNVYNISYHYHIPCINTYLSRRSKEEIFLQLQLLIPTLERSDELFSKIDLDKKILIYSLDKDMRWRNIEVISSNLYSLKLRDFISPLTSINELRKNAKLNLQPSDLKLSLSNPNNIIVDYLGKQNIIRFKPDSLSTTEEYQLTFWSYNYHQDSLGNNRIQITQNNKVIGQTYYIDQYDVIARKWGRVNVPFKIISYDSVELNIMNPIKSSPYYYDKVFDIPFEKKKRVQPLIFSEFNIYEND
ncbi:hypothetical protein [Flammeovirga agarivorans]|uniref:Uncharacterized protein n=1 Tax=Flammeovirga agarivorans TaxID=2726742 RepID=A0A7X8XXG1_9BACT|nr:hypothetical protein [Flammeovirga agarivorans]NLR93214.1 hypothetical protein [Flammeovirga agarivorans]